MERSDEREEEKAKIKLDDEERSVSEADLTLIEAAAAKGYSVTGQALLDLVAEIRRHRSVTIQAAMHRCVVPGLTRDQARALCDIYSDEMEPDDPAAQDAFSALTVIANAPVIEHQSKDLGPSRDGAYEVRLGRAWIEAEWDGDYLHVRGNDPMECTVVDEWGSWLRPLRPQNTECKSVAVDMAVVDKWVNEAIGSTRTTRPAWERLKARLLDTECRSVAPNMLAMVKLLDGMTDGDISLELGVDEIRREVAGALRAIDCGSVDDGVGEQ